MATAQTTYKIAREVETQDLDTRTDAGVEVAMTSKTATDNFTVEVSQTVVEGQSIMDDTRALTTEANEPSADQAALACTARTRTGDQCATCQDEARYARLDAELPVAETDDGTCPGHNAPCGRAAMPGDPYCARCRIASQRDRDRVIQEWEAVRDAAVAAAKAQEAPEAAPAPF
ncbi:hypothetical protein AB0899_29655 [Streptomyces sp. NPDC007002]|uniref:hypothetical protein n=1 Tax=Streptomyces sp. NPDC007002 TaxID=3156910 RepID=UPI003451BA4B